VGTEGRKRRRILITGVSDYLGLRLAQRLAADDRCEAIFGVDIREPAVPIDRLEFIRSDISSPLIARVIHATHCDTIVHTNITSLPGHFGSRSQMKENNVIGTMQLLAAAQRAEHVKHVVVKSSAAVYGAFSDEPSVLTEEHGVRADLSGYGRDCAEAEMYARDFGRRRPDVGLIILRTQNVIGPTADTSIVRYLSLPIIPTALGFDPRIQLLHEDDAVGALLLALSTTRRGIFNIAGPGVVYLSQAIRLLGRRQLPLVLPAARIVATGLRRTGLVDFAVDQLPVMLFGRVVDTRRASEVLGFTAQASTRSCLVDFRDRQRAATRSIVERALIRRLHDAVLKEGAWGNQ
jgi:UDP-glucose 4-epimerase